MTVHDREFLFFWIPKAAGSSVFRALSQHGCRKLIFAKEYRSFSNSGRATFGHVDIRYLLQQNHLSTDYYNRAFKFAIVRNPWDRMVSLYYYNHYNERMSFERFVRLIEHKTKLRDTFFYKILFPKCNSLFFILVYKSVLKVSKDMTRFLPLPAAGPYNTLELSQCNPQADWVVGKDGTLMVDYLCRFEELNKDFSEVCHRLGISASLPHENKTNHKNYRDYYNEELKRIVGDIYKIDIELFNFSF